MDYLVGHTGFVGSNLREAHHFDRMFHSADIAKAFGEKPDLLVYSGVRAEMFLANKDPAADLAVIENAIAQIQKIAPKRLVLISTIAVYPHPQGIDETAQIDAAALPAYGRNRHALECWVMEHAGLFPYGYLIVRLPALYGKNLKKNFLYDYIHRIPAMLTETKFLELTGKDALLTNYYEKKDNGFYQCIADAPKEKAMLRAYFEKAGFSALHFTDSRSVYQFYNLAYLWDHIETALSHGIPILNTATQPVSAGELYRALTGEAWTNKLQKPLFAYDCRTKYDRLFGGQDGYLYDKAFVLKDIQRFVAREMETQTQT